MAHIKKTRSKPQWVYADRSRRVKTDRRDARALATACRLGAYRPAYRVSDEGRHVRGVLSVREAVVRTRVRYISLVRALLRKQGYRIRSGAAQSFIRRVEELELPRQLQEEIAPLLRVMASLNEEITASDRELEQQSKSDERVQRLM